jgi:hypothetical protein
VVLRDGRAEFVRGDDIDGLLALGELVTLVDLDYDPGPRWRAGDRGSRRLVP